MADSALQKIDDLSKAHEFTIIRLYRNIIEPDDSENGQKRASDASDATADKPSTPASLAAEFVHVKVCQTYCKSWSWMLVLIDPKEHYSKLRFLYLEQVTKEKFLRAITAETPLFIEPEENARLEEQLAEEKMALKAQKEEVQNIIRDLETRARSLVKRMLLHRQLPSRMSSSF